MPKRYLASVFICLMILMAIVYVSAIASVRVYTDINGQAGIALATPVWAYILMLLGYYYAFMSIWGLFQKQEENTISRPRPENFLVRYSGEKMKVISSEAWRDVLNDKNLAVTLFLLKKPHYIEGQPSGIFIPEWVLCYTCEVFERGEELLLKYDQGHNQLGYFNERNRVATASF